MGAFDLPLPGHPGATAGNEGVRSAGSVGLAERGPGARQLASATVAGDVDVLGVAGLAPPKLVNSKPRRRSSALVLRTLGPLALLFVWWYASHTHLISAQVAASPGSTWDAFWTMIKNGTLWENLSASLKLASTGMAIGGISGLLLGLLTGLTRLGDELLDPVLQMLRTIPIIALSPLLIVWFGIGDGPKILLIALATAFPLYLNAHSGVRNVDPKILETSRVYGVSRLHSIWEIVLPAALPQLLVGLRMALTISLLALIFAEMINTTVGIGYLLNAAESDFQTNVMFVCIAIYAIWGLSADLIVRLLKWLLMPWERAGRTAKPSFSRR